MIPDGGIFSHIDFKRDRAKLIPIGPNKGEIHYHLNWRTKPFYTYKTLISILINIVYTIETPCFFLYNNFHINPSKL